MVMQQQPSSKRPPLTPAQQALVVKNTGLAGWFIEKLQARYSWWLRGVSRSEIRSICLLGICEAARTFNSNGGATFSTWAVYSMIHAVQGAMQHVGVVSIPRSIFHRAGQRLNAEQWDQLRRVRAPISITADRHTSTLIADECHIDEVVDPYSAAQELEEVEDRHARSNTASKLIYEALEQLPYKQAMAVRLTHLNDLTLAEAGAVLGISKERVRQLRVRGLAALKRLLETEKVPL